jgi:hypothetical protein
MGLESSKEEPLPSEIDDPKIRERITKSWTIDKILANKNNAPQSTDTKPTMGASTINKLGFELATFFRNNEFKEVVILELMAGNCTSSLIVHEHMMDILRQNIKYSWMATDVFTSLKRETTIPFKECNAVDAVKIFGEQSNILLLISPPPYSYVDETETKTDLGQGDDDAKDLGYADYYAIHDYVDQMAPGQEKYIIIAGELGASDGSTGMYRYLMEHKNMKLIKRSMLCSFASGFGDLVEKELFIFVVAKK